MVALTLSVWYNYSMPLMVCCEAPRVVQGVVPGRLHCCRGETNENRSGVLKIHIKSLPNQMKSMTRRESLRPVAFLFSFEQRLLTRVQLASRGLIPARKLVPPAKCSSLQRGLPKYNEDTEPPMRGKFNHPPSATVYCHRYGSDGKLLTPLSCAEGKTGASIHRRALRPVLDFLVLAVLLLPLELWWRTREAECTDRSPVALVLLRATRGLWIVWLTHAAGLLDEALRMFLGIRLTQGLGTPTSVGKVDSKMSRRAEVVAEVRSGFLDRGKHQDLATSQFVWESGSFFHLDKGPIYCIRRTNLFQFYLLLLTVILFSFPCLPSSQHSHNQFNETDILA